MERLKKQIDFILEIDKLKEIYRQTYIASGKRKENDAEHSWHLALMCVLLSEYANEEIDLAKAITMVLIHDIVEIDAGDTYAYDVEGNATKAAREEKAAERLFNILPDDQAAYIKELWEEFEGGETAEARFCTAIDRAQPILLNDFIGGWSWKERGVTRSQINKRSKKINDGSQVIFNYIRDIVEQHTELGNIAKG